MSFEKEDRVVLHDEHSEFDGQVGTVEQVSETMFGDETYVVSFEEGQEAGLPEDNLEPADDDAGAGDGPADAGDAEPANEDDA